MGLKSLGDCSNTTYSTEINYSYCTCLLLCACLPLLPFIDHLHLGNGAIKCDPFEYFQSCFTDIGVCVI